jgi:hypothetical protein
VLPEVPWSPDVPLDWPDVAPLEPPELELDVLEDEPGIVASAEPVPFPEFVGPEGPAGPAGGLSGPAPSGPISRVEQSTAPHMSERAAGARTKVAIPVRMAIVMVEQPTRAAVFM